MISCPRCLDEVSLFPVCRYLFFLVNLSKENMEHLCSCLHIWVQCLNWYAVWTCCFSILVLFDDLLISSIISLVTLIGWFVCAVSMFIVYSGAGLFKSFLKCSNYLFYYFWISVIGFPSLFFSRILYRLSTEIYSFRWWFMGINTWHVVFIPPLSPSIWSSLCSPVPVDFVRLGKGCWKLRSIHWSC